MSAVPAPARWPVLRAERAFPAAPAAVAVCREFARLQLGDWALPGQLAQDAVLVVSELMTNALRHAETPVVVSFTFDGSALTLELTDGVSGSPTGRTPAPLDEDGRGMRIVAQLCDSWGVEPSPVGKRVWARLTV